MEAAQEGFCEAAYSVAASASAAAYAAAAAASGDAVTADLASSTAISIATATARAVEQRLVGKVSQAYAKQTLSSGTSIKAHLLH